MKGLPKIAKFLGRNSMKSGSGLECLESLRQPNALHTKPGIHESLRQLTQRNVASPGHAAGYHVTRVFENHN